MMEAHGLWIFGYGSLMWRPGFPFAVRARGRVHGLSRRLCVLSVHHRGTEERPGLVLGLDRGGVCDGMAYWVEARDLPDVLAYLKARELVNGVYREAHVPIRLSEMMACGSSAEETGPVSTGVGDGSSVGVLDGAPPSGGPPFGDTTHCGMELAVGRSVRALTYIAERAHPSYRGGLTLGEQARVVAGARGRSGANIDYVLNTLAHLRTLGICDRDLERLMVTAGGFWAGRQRRLSNARTAFVHHGARSDAEASFVRVPKRLAHRPMRKGERRRFHHRLRIDT